MTFPGLKNNIFIIKLLICVLAILSCERIKNKGERIVDKTKEAIAESKTITEAKQSLLKAKQKVGDKKNELIDKAFPTYDRYTADTKANKKRFREHLGVELTPDIKNIYAYGDFMGIDYKVLMAFTCDQATIMKIVAAKEMELSKEHDSGLSFIGEPDWWLNDKKEILTPYKVGKEYEYWEYLWYDPKTRQAYYEEFSL